MSKIGVPLPEKPVKSMLESGKSAKNDDVAGNQQSKREPS